MAIALVGTVTKFNGAAATTAQTVTIPSTTAGNCLVAIMTTRSTTATHTYGTLGGTAWTSTGAFNGGSINTVVSIAYIVNIPGGQTSFTVTNSASAVKTVVVAEFSGVATSGQPDVAAVSKGTGTSSTTPTSSAITTTTAGDLVVTACATGVNNATATYASAGPTAAAGTLSGWVLLANHSNAGGTNASTEQVSAYVLDAPAGLYTTQWTWPSSTYSSWAIALKGAGGGGGSTPPRFETVRNYHQTARVRASSY